MDLAHSQLLRDDIRPLAGGGEERWDASVGRWRAQPQASTSRALERMTRELATVESPVEEIEDLLVAPANPQRGTILQYIGPNYAGVHVTHERAFMEAAIWACIDVISGSMAASDWNVYSGIRGSDAGKLALPDDQLQFLLNVRPNPEMTALSGKRAVMIAAVGYGNGYAEIGWDLAGRCAALWPISPDRVEPIRNEYGQFVYRCSQDYAGGFVDLDPADVFHIRGAGITGHRGDDMIAKALHTVAMAIAVDQFAASYYANGTNLGGVVTTKGKLDTEPFERMKDQWNNRGAGGRTGSRNAFKTAVLDGGATFTQIDSNAQKADLSNWKDRVIEECCRWFRVPPHKIAHLLRATNNNIEHQGIEFTRDTLRPWKIEIEQEAQYKLISGRGPKKFVELDLDWAEQGDYLSRMQAYREGLNTGVFNVNDVLRKLGENTIGDEGNIRIVQGAMIPLSRVGESYKVTGTPTKPEAPNDPTVPGVEPGTAPKPTSNGTATAWLASIYARTASRVELRAADSKPMADDEIDRYLREQLADMARELFDLSPARDPISAAVAIGIDAVRERMNPTDAAQACVLNLTEPSACKS